MSLHTINSPAPTSYANVHPGYVLIDLGEKFENRQIELIMKHDAENKEVIEQLNVLNRAQTCMMSLRDKKEIGEGDLHIAIGELNRAFPDLNFEDFIQNYETFSEQQWDRAHESISNKEKLLMSTFNPKMMKIEELISDKNKVHEILAEIIKQLNEATSYFNRNRSH